MPTKLLNIVFDTNYTGQVPQGGMPVFEMPKEEVKKPVKK
jgi:hypothetical protein